MKGQAEEISEIYRFLVENSPDGFFMAEVPSGKIIFLNNSVREMFGYSYEEAMKVSVWDVLIPEEHQVAMERMQKGIMEKIPSPRHIYAMRRKDGSTFKGEISVSYMIFCKKTVVHGILRDVTEQIRLQEQLRHAQKMEAIGTLAGGISHEFNNLMQAISGYTELLMLSKNIDAGSRQKLEAIRKSVQRASELTRQILIFSQKAESRFQMVKLNHEVMRVSKLLKKTIPKMIDIRLSTDENLRDIKADPALIGQVIMNLGINARDAMSDGGTLSITTSDVVLDEKYYRNHPELKPGHYALLSISDTGHGMSKEVLEHLFVPFYTTKGMGRAAGLGLAMVYGIIREHDGHIICYSEPDVGTTFKIYLPVAEKPQQAQESVTEEKPPGGNETILLVDDEEFIRNLGKELLKQFGYTVITAHDGETAASVYQKQFNQIDIIILDMLMPGMGGRKCLKEILSVNPDAKVLIASGYSPDGMTSETVNSGAKDFIGKPYQINELLKMIRKVLDEK